MNSDIVESAVVERILVALDASPQSQMAMRAAARLAAAMHAELQGLFVEDANLFHLCNSPFCREIGLRTATVRPLESQIMERQLRVMAAEMRRSLARVAGEAQVRWSFQVTRGSVEQELLAAAETALLVSLGRSGWLAGKRLGSTTRALVERTQRPLFIPGNQERLTHPLTVLYNGSAGSDRALALATRLAQQAAQPLRLMLISPEDEAELLQTQSRAFLQTHHVQATFALVNTISELASVLQQIHNDSFVLPLHYAELLAGIDGPVLLVP